MKVICLVFLNCLYYEMLRPGVCTYLSVAYLLYLTKVFFMKTDDLPKSLFTNDVTTQNGVWKSSKMKCSHILWLKFQYFFSLFSAENCRRTVIFYQVCTLGYPAGLGEPLGKISSLGLPSKVIFRFQIVSNVRIKPYP